MGPKNIEISLDPEVKSRVAINEDLGTFVSKTIPAILLVASLATFIYLLYGGLQWITAGGDKGKIEEARNKITQGIVGLGIVASSWAIFQLVTYFFGIDILDN